MWAHEERVMVVGVITVVWSSYGHRFMATGEHNKKDEPYESCMTCGGQWLLARDLERNPDGSYGVYVNDAGNAPVDCSGRTDLRHGEAPCQDDNGHGCAVAANGEVCEHLAQTVACNCLWCTG